MPYCFTTDCIVLLWIVLKVFGSLLAISFLLVSVYLSAGAGMCVHVYMLTCYCEKCEAYAYGSGFTLILLTYMRIVLILR